MNQATTQNLDRWFAIKMLACMLFFTFAMTTDAVGVIIPKVIEEFSINFTQAGAFHYTTMIAIALSGILLGHLPDKLGSKNALLIGLFLYGLSCMLFAIGNSYVFFLCLLFVGGIAIGVFKTSALSLIGGITKSDEEHTRMMNILEGFFAIGAIMGPFVATQLIKSELAWQNLYVIAAIICIFLLIISSVLKYPKITTTTEQPASMAQTIKMIKDPYALFFGIAIACYVVTEAAIYVWMPTLLLDYTGSDVLFATYSLTIFFALRAAGRFMGWWILSVFSWTLVLLCFSLLIFLCYLLTLIIGVDAGVFLLPISGLFMSMMYPTLNSKGISCFPKAKHGSVAGLILFFTAVAAAFGPLVMGFVGDLFGHLKYGFGLTTVVAGVLLLMMIYNHIKQPVATRLNEINRAETKD